MSRRIAVIAVLLISLVAATVAALASEAADAGALPTFDVRGSVSQVAVLGAAPNSIAELLAPGGSVVASDTVDELGGVLFRDSSVDVLDTGVRIRPGPGYRVRINGETSDPVTVLDPDTAPDRSLYDGQTLDEGFGYIETRDGTTLSVNITIPDGPGPHPTVIEYSGYSPSNPASPSQVLTPLQLQGYATVAVNMRGTGCAGGAFWYWEPLQSLDGYDVIEAVAAQSWSGNIGMVGISYSGISQLFVASTQPPSLDAITPLSVIADTYRSTLYPGGILNDGFALDWAIGRVNDAQPYALGWVRDRIDAGDTECDANQKLRLQSMDILAEISHVRYWEERGDGLAPWSFIDQIEVPTLLIGAWQDEQTGPHFATMLDLFAPDTKQRFILTNGTHMEGLGPQYIGYAFEWLDFYVAEKIPEINPVIRALAPALYEDLLGKGGLLPPDRFTGYPDHASALAAFEAEDPVWIGWENGAGDVDPGYPVPTAITTHDAWPLPEIVATSWWLAPDGRLEQSETALDGAEPRGISSYLYDPTVQPEANYCCGSSAIWKMQPGYDWQPHPQTYGLSFLSDPLDEPLSLAGSGSVDLWLRAEVTDVDLEVNLSEVRPDGQEMYIQSGWLRARQRAEDPTRSTELEPWHTHLEADASPVPADDFVLARVELMPFAHVVRAGSQLRLTIEPPGGNRALWEFDAEDHGAAVLAEVAHSAVYPSRLALSEVSDPPVPEALPACPYSIRNQPCRDWVPSGVVTGVAATVGARAGGTLIVSWDEPETEDPVVGYDVVVMPTGETFTVPGDVTRFDYRVPNRFGEYAFEVVAWYGDGPAPASSASLLVAVAQRPDPTTTTSTTTTSTPPSTTGATTSTSTASPTTAHGDASGPGGPSLTLTLPVTGAAVALLTALGVGLMVVGSAMRRNSRRG